MGHFSKEIGTMSIIQMKMKICMEKDERMHKFNPSKLLTLPSAFKNAMDVGTITAGNSSSLGDGASSLLMVSDAVIKDYRLFPIARILQYAEFEGEQEDFSVAPVHAIRKLLKSASLGVHQIALFEINEAFAATVLICMKVSITKFLM